MIEMILEIWFPFQVWTFGVKEPWLRAQLAGVKVPLSLTMNVGAVRPVEFDGVLSAGPFKLRNENATRH